MKTNYYSTLLLIMLIFISGTTIAQPCENKNPSAKTFSVIIDSPTDNSAGIDYNDRGYNGIEDSNGGEFLIAGDSHSYITQDVFVNRLDYSGTLTESMICESNFGANEAALWMNEISPNTTTPAGGYIYTGYTGTAPNRSFLLKATDKTTGFVNYAQLFGSNNQADEIGRCVIQDSFNDYVAVGVKKQGNTSTIFAVGVNQNFFPVKWVMEYYIQGDDDAFSVAEVPGLTDPSGMPVYGITGKSGERVFLLLVNSSNGLPFWGDATLYDIDNNGFTDEVGYSITIDQFGEIVIAGSAEIAPNSPLPGLLETQIFVLKTSISTQLNPLWINYYDIQNSKREWARHITIDKDGNLILTGTHRVSNQLVAQPIGTTTTKTGQSFILNLNFWGNVNWCNTYFDSDYNGSIGYRVEQVSTGGYYMTGTIWKDIDYDGDDFPASYNDQFAVCTDPTGLLYNCECCAPLEVVVREKGTEYERIPIEYIPQQAPQQWWDYGSKRVDALTDYCDQYCPDNNPCDSLTLTLTPELVGENGCCFSVDINNQHGNPIVGLNAQILTSDWIFNTGTVNVPAGWNWAGVPSNDDLTIEYGGGIFPIGPTSNVLRFCLADANPISPTPQQILFSWYELVGNDTIAVCDTLVITNCESNQGEECAKIINEAVECDTLQTVYELTFQVFNNNPSQTATSLLLYGLTAGYNFKSTPTGLPLTSIAMPVSIPPLGTSPPITIYVDSNIPLTSATNIYFNYGITGQGFCCFVTKPFCIELPPCYCLETANFNFECIEDSSKYRLTFDVTNHSNIATNATGLVITVLNSHSPPITLVPSGGFFNWTSNPLPYGSTRTISTCISPFPISDPNIILSYTLHHGIFPNVDPNLCCYDIPNDTIAVPNCCDELVIDGDFDDPIGNSFTTGSALPYDCTCNSGSWCIDTNALNKCTATGWTSVTAPPGCSPNYLIIDGAAGTVWSQPVDIEEGKCYEFSFQYHPNISGGGQPNLNVVVGLDIIGSTNGVSGNWNLYTYNYVASITGTVNLSIVQTTSPQFSDYGIDCVSFGCVPCNNECCTNYEAFCDRVDAGFAITFTNSANCTVGVSPLALGQCDEVLWNWGDGTTSVGTWNTSLTHTYSSSGNYVICMIVREVDEDGNVCWEKEVCRQVQVNCFQWEPCDPVIDLSDIVIPSGVIQAGELIISSGTVQQSTDVTLKAGQNINLNNGFGVEAGAAFNASIEPCCCSNNPLNDLPWLQQYIGNPNYSIARGIYQNKCIFIVTDFCIVSDGVTAYYDCKGNLICESYQIGTTCPANFTVQNITVLQGC